MTSTSCSPLIPKHGSGRPRSSPSTSAPSAATGPARSGASTTICAADWAVSGSGSRRWARRAPGGVGLVRVRPGISQPVPVWRAAAEIPALFPRLDRHRGPHPDAGPGDLPLRREPEDGHGVLVVLGGVVDPAARFRHPQLDAVMLEHRRHRRILATVERPLILPDHDRVPLTARIRQLGDQRGGLRTPPPRHRPAFPCVEELRHDHPVPADQRPCLLPLPRSRGDRVLPVLRRHPPVEREPQPAVYRSPGLWAARPRRPRLQAIPACSRGSSPFPLAHCRHGGHLPRSTSQHLPGIRHHR